MNLLPDLIAAVFILAICICAIKAADNWRAYWANRRQDKFNMAKRDREAMLSAIREVAREALTTLSRGKK